MLRKPTHRGSEMQNHAPWADGLPMTNATEKRFASKALHVRVLTPLGEGPLVLRDRGMSSLRSREFELSAPCCGGLASELNASQGGNAALPDSVRRSSVPLETGRRKIHALT